MGEPSCGDDPKKKRSNQMLPVSTKGPTQQGDYPDSGQNNEQGDTRPTRSRWPRDRAKRLVAMAKAMPDFLGPYFGGEAAIAAAMSVTPMDVREVIQASPELIELQEIAVTSVEALLLDHGLYVALNSKNIAGVKWALSTRFPDKYGKASATTSKGKGFSAPTDDPDDLESVLDKK